MKSFKFNKSLAMLLALAILTTCLAGILRQYSKNNTPFVKTDFIMDTFIEYRLYGEGAEECVRDISLALRKMEQDFSSHIDSSYISKINNNSGIKQTNAPRELIDVLERAREISLETNLNYNVLIGAVARLWNVTGETPYVPTESEINKALSLCDINDLELDRENNTVYLKKKGNSLDLGGILKGEATKTVLEIAKAHGIKKGFVSIGGNMVVVGGEFTFGIRDPKGSEREYFASLALSDGDTMSTAGGYERFFEADGKTYAHIFSSKTGAPAESEFLSVTIVGKDGSACDSLATAIYVGGRELLSSYIDRSDIFIIAVTNDNKIILSNGDNRGFELNSSNPNNYNLA